MIVLVGESASGKSTVEKVLVEKYGYKKTISYTTRPVREREIQGVDYNFLSKDEFVEKFHNGFFVEIGSYNNWYYGSTEEQYTEDAVCVLTPHGLRQIQKNLKNKEKLHMKTIYINVPRRDRLIKILQRGDDIDEAIRRNQSDVGQYDGILDEVDYEIKNDGYLKSAEEIAEEIINYINKK